MILRDFETQSFGVVVLSSVTAAAIGRAAFGSAAFLHLPGFGVVSGLEYPLYALLGALAAVMGVVFIRVLYGAEDLGDRLWRGPEWLRPAAGGILLGALLIALPQMYGVGYPVLERAVEGHYVAGLLVLLLVGKVVATSLTMSIGGSGGVFAPSLFMGAMLGSAYGLGVHGAFPHLTASAGAYGLVGMGAVFAASARAPITAVLIIYELTGEYSIILPLMLAIVAATALSARLSPDTIYTLKLRRRGIDLQRRTRPLLADLSVSDAMGPAPEPVSADAPFSVLLDRFAAGEGGALPVLDGAERLVGVIAPADLEAIMDDEDPGQVTAADIAHTPPRVHAEDPLDAAIQALGRADEAGLPVVGGEGDGTVVGWIGQNEVMRLYRRRLEEAGR